MVVAKRKAVLKKVKPANSSLLERFVPILLVSSIAMSFAVGALWREVENVKKAGGLVSTSSVASSKATSQAKGDSSKLLSEVMPDNYKLGVKFNDVILKMVETGAIDKDKFIQLYAERAPLTDKQKELFEKVSNDEIVLNQENAQLLLNILWPLGISNKSKVLSEGPMGTQYKDKAGSFASTGGWTLGKEEGGKLFNSKSLIELTPEQENLVKEIADSIYRPCCGNHTGFPDCNHGAAMLGFIELAVAQGMPKDEIYKKALVLNSYWFPQTYAEIATYFKAKGTAWNKVNAKEVLGANYSSSQGSQAINQALQGDVPKVQSGGGCGV